MDLQHLLKSKRKKYYTTGSNKETYWLTRFFLLRGLGFLYFLVFFPIIHQFEALLGENGLLPVSLHLQRYSSYFDDSWFTYWKLPTLFWISATDHFAVTLAYVGLALSIVVICGYANAFIMFFLWLLQLSFLHVGQTFWSFGWETNLLEIGFLGIFLCPLFDGRPFSIRFPPSKIIMLLYRWVLFRLMFGAGLIKLRGDSCWSDLTCMNFHFETQPIPNPLSPYFHFLPDFFLKGLVLFNHFVELGIPWLLFLPFPLISAIAGVFFILLQLGVIVGGNYAWINYITLVMIIPCFDDRFLKKFTPNFIKENFIYIAKYRNVKWYQSVVVLCLTSLIVFLSYKPVMNLIGPRQVMNTSYDQFHIVNSYGVFGSITKKRFEIIIKGTKDSVIDQNTDWQEYEIPCKPGDIYKTPCSRAPYHYRLTWQIWFAAMGSYHYNPWLVYFVYKLLEGDKGALSLLEKNPFPMDLPKYIKLDLYHYQFADPKNKEGSWYTRKFVREYLPPLSLESNFLKNYIRSKGWSKVSH